jgi:hypothetical protein
METVVDHGMEMKAAYKRRTRLGIFWRNIKRYKALLLNHLFDSQ